MRCYKQLVTGSEQTLPVQERQHSPVVISQGAAEEIGERGRTYTLAY
jgi:hypothetical protein